MVQENFACDFWAFALNIDHGCALHKGSFDKPNLAIPKRKHSDQTNLSTLTADNCWEKPAPFALNSSQQLYQYICQQSVAQNDMRFHENEMCAVHSDPPEIAANPDQLGGNNKKKTPSNLNNLLMTTTRSRIFLARIQRAETEGRRR